MHVNSENWERGGASRGRRGAGGRGVTRRESGRVGEREAKGSRGDRGWNGTERNGRREKERRKGGSKVGKAVEAGEQVWGKN